MYLAINVDHADKLSLMIIYATDYSHKSAKKRNLIYRIQSTLSLTIYITTNCGDILGYLRFKTALILSWLASKIKFTPIININTNLITSDKFTS